MVSKSLPQRVCENLQSLAVALNTVGAASIKRTHEILSEVFNIPMKQEPEWIKNSGGFMMPQTVNTPILISVPNVEMQAWNNAVFSRNSKGIDENHPEQKWASAFIDLLLEMKKVKDKAVEKGKDFLSYYHYHKFDKKYDELIEQAQNRECSMAVVANKTFPILCFCLGYYGDFSSPLHPLVGAIVTWIFVGRQGKCDKIVTLKFVLFSNKSIYLLSV